jgi:hypothetical protein
MPRPGAGRCHSDQRSEHKHGYDWELSPQVHRYRYSTYRRSRAEAQVGPDGPVPYLRAALSLRP